MKITRQLWNIVTRSGFSGARLDVCQPNVGDGLRKIRNFHPYGIPLGRAAFSHLGVRVLYQIKHIIISYSYTGLDRPIGFQEVQAPSISRQSKRECSKVLSPTHRQPLSPRGNPWFSFLLEAESTPEPYCGQKD